MQHRNINRKLHNATAAVKNLHDVADRKMQSLRGGVKMTKRAVKSVQRYGQRHPYLVVGAVSFAAGFLGYIFGAKRNYY